jgi:hypothetical protein
MTAHRPVVWAALVSLSAAFVPCTYAHEPGEIFVGRNAAGRLVAHHEGHMPVELHESVFPQHPGWATSLMGFEAAPLDEPAEDFNRLALSTQVRLEMISVSSGCAMYPGAQAMSPGQSVMLGDVPFDFHPIFSVAPGAARGESFVLEFVLHDDSGLYSSSEVLRIELRGDISCGTSDFNGDGDAGTDQDIEAFFACLAGSCCAACYERGADFDANGDAGTDADIEAFFRVLAGAEC